MSKYTLVTTSSFKKDYKKLLKRNYDMSLLDNVVDKLLEGSQLPEKNKDHALTGNWMGYRMSHSSRLLLVYRVYEKDIVLSLLRTGTHSDLNF